MYNDIINILTVIGKTSDVSGVMFCLLNSERDVTFNEFLPVPYRHRRNKKDMYNPESSYVKWTMDNWGCMYDASETIVLASNKVMFTTPRDIPNKVIENLSERFPEVRFTLEFADEDQGFNVGEVVYLNGDVLDSKLYEGGSMEAYEHSMDITGDDYYVNEFIRELTENDCEVEFPNMCIRMTFKMRRIEDYFPSHVLTMFESWAVDEEDYEFASMCKKVREKLGSLK